MSLFSIAEDAFIAKTRLVFFRISAPQSKNVVSHFRSHAQYFLLSLKIPEVMSRWTILFHWECLLYRTYNMYNLLVWEWIDEKFDIKWMYLLYDFVDTAFLLSGAALYKCKVLLCSFCCSEFLSVECVRIIVVQLICNFLIHVEKVGWDCAPRNRPCNIIFASVDHITPCRVPK